jgi:UTP--glucose-1-phosphate uridylyltransferase
MNSPKPVRTAIFPVAGLGTRLLPATKVMPKEMLPIVDTPLIQLAIDEARDAGIESFVFVINHGKEMLLEHFDEAPALEDVLKRRGKAIELKKLADAMLPDGHLSTVYQKNPLGLGHAVWCARDVVGDEPFAVILPDDAIKSNISCLKQMHDFYKLNGGNIVASMEVAPTQVSKYGMIDLESKYDHHVKIRSVIEKPPVGQSPSNYAVIGRYILQPEIFMILDDMVKQNATGAGGEIQLTDAIQAIISRQNVYGYLFDGERHDCGSELGFIKAQLAFGMERAHLKADLLDYIQKTILKQ